MPEFWFYHLESSALEAVLPGLLEKTRANGWRALIKTTENTVEALDKYLWTYRDNSFLPHGSDQEPSVEAQPIVLSSTIQSDAGFDAVFLINNQEMETLSSSKRCIVMINGQSDSNVQFERKRWKTLQGQGAVMTYWQQNQTGQWEKKA